MQCWIYPGTSWSGQYQIALICIHPFSTTYSHVGCGARSLNRDEQASVYSLKIDPSLMESPDFL